MKYISPLPCLCALLALATVNARAAGTDTWVGTTSSWSTGGWTGGNNPPQSGDSLIFDVAGTSGTTLNDDLTCSSFLTFIEFTANAPAYTISGNAFKTYNSGFSGNNAIYDLSSAVETINDNIVFSGANNVNVGVTLSNGSLVLNGIISSSTPGYAINKQGVGMLTLGGTNTYTGNTIIGAGTISVSSIGNSGAAGNLGEGTTINIGSGTNTSTLLYTGTGEQTSKILNLAGTTGGATLDQSGTGVLEFTASANTATGAGSKTLTLQGSTSGSGIIDGAIVDDLTGTYTTALTKLGTNTWTLAGANTYTGATKVNVGTLLVNGSTASGSAVTVQATTSTNADLGGTGTVAGSVTVGTSSGTGLSIVTPGTDGTIGTLNTGALTFNSSAKSEFKFDLNSGTGAIDLLNVTGALNIGSSALLVGNDLNSGADGLTIGQVLVLASTTTGITGSFSGYGNNSILSLNGNSYEVNYGTVSGYSNDLTLTVTALAVPEPSTYALLALGLIMLIGGSSLRTTRRMRTE